MKKKPLSQLSRFEEALSRQAMKIVNAKVPAELRVLNEIKVALSDPRKKLAEIEEKLKAKCAHQLIFEIPRRRVEASKGTKVIPATRICLVCWLMENAIQKRNSRKRLSSTFTVMTAKPIGVVRRNYGAITITFGKRPITQYVKAILATHQFGDDALEHIMYPLLYPVH